MQSANETGNGANNCPETAPQSEAKELTPEARAALGAMPAAAGEMAINPPIRGEWRSISTFGETGWGETEHVLVYSPTLGVKDAYAGCFRGSIHVSIGSYHGNAVEYWGVTHWMPLPNPPELG